MHQSKSILIVDDDEDDKDLFLEALKNVDSSIVCMSAANGEEALRLLQNLEHSMPNLIFLDMNMPRMDGKECLIAIKKMENLQHIPVIIYTTTSRNEDMEEMKKKGAVHFLTKPTEFDKISSEIKYVLNRWC